VSSAFAALVAPSRPFRASRAPAIYVVVTAPFDPAPQPDPTELERRYAWALGWMRMHRWLAGREVAIEWRPLSAGIPEGC
jgi:hypothetical protein